MILKKLKEKLFLCDQYFGITSIYIHTFALRTLNIHLSTFADHSSCSGLLTKWSPYPSSPTRQSQLGACRYYVALQPYGPLIILFSLVIENFLCFRLPPR